MSDNDFPSGPWTGFFTYNRVPGKWRTDLSLTFANGRITGEGNDSIGPFVIAGRYDAVGKECHWTKTYVAAHDVFYKGFREGKGIWGTWEIRATWCGGFHIWPLGSEGGENEAELEELDLPAEFVTIGNRRQVGIDARATRPERARRVRGSSPLERTTEFFRIPIASSAPR
jgi:hypothetical protein